MRRKVDTLAITGEYDDGFDHDSAQLEDFQPGTSQSQIGLVCGRKDIALGKPTAGDSVCGSGNSIVS
jgi:hypothetical protein